MNSGIKTTGRRTTMRTLTKGSSKKTTKPRQLSLSWSAYRDHPAVAQSDVKLAFENPMLFRNQRILKVTPPSSETTQQAWGKACETAIKTKGHPTDVALIPSDVLNDQGHRKGSRWASFAAEHDGQVLLTQNELDALYGPLGCYTQAIENIQSHKAAKALVYGRTKRSWNTKILWDCPRTGLERKAELDIILWNAGIICDIKTAYDPTPYAFRWAIKKWGYDIQASTYLEAIRALKGGEWRFAFVVIRNSPPYDVYVYEDTPEFLIWADHRAAQYLDRFLSYQQSGKWLPEGWGESVPLEPII